jgi:hypothetical protein
MTNETSMAPSLGDLALGKSFTFDELVDAMQRRRGRRLRIVELTELGEKDGLCAVWIMTDVDDIVLHVHSDSALHRQQFVLHELAHMILEHTFDDHADVPDILLPDISADAKRRLLRRQNLDTIEEIEAESLADHLAAAIRGSTMICSRYLEIFA